MLSLTGLKAQKVLISLDGDVQHTSAQTDEYVAKT